MKKFLLVSFLTYNSYSHTMQPPVNTTKELIDASTAPTTFRKFVGTWLALGTMQTRCAFHKEDLSSEVKITKEQMLQYLKGEREQRTVKQYVHPSFAALIHEVGKDHGINPQNYDITRTLDKEYSSFSARLGTLNLSDSPQHMIENQFSEQQIRSQLDHEFSHTQEDAPMNITARKHVSKNPTIAPIPLYFHIEERTDARGILNSKKPIESAVGLYQSLQTIKGFHPNNSLIQTGMNKRLKTAHWIHTNLQNEQTDPNTVIFPKN